MNKMLTESWNSESVKPKLGTIPATLAAPIAFLSQRISHVFSKLDRTATPSVNVPVKIVQNVHKDRRNHETQVELPHKLALQLLPLF